MSEAQPIVLVADDERFFREAICDALREAGFACRSVASAEETLAGAADPAVGVLVLDLGLPGANGTLLLRHLREVRPTLRVIVLATHADQEDVLEALRLDASDYLAKPLHDEELVLAVRRALGAFALEARLATLRQRLRRLAARSAALTKQAAAATGAEDRAARLGAEAGMRYAGCSPPRRRRCCWPTTRAPSCAWWRPPARACPPTGWTASPSAPGSRGKCSRRASRWS